MSQFLLKSGRTLDLLDNHHDSKFAILFHHGTPGDSTMWRDWHDELASSSLRTISVSRPGYSLSDRNKGRRVVDANTDHREILDQFEIENFVSIGWSGGGPHALATSLDPRCRGVISMAGVGQFGQSDLDFLEGMGPENHDEFGVAQEGEVALREWMNVNASAMQHVDGNGLRDAFGGLIGDADKEILAGVFADDMAAAMRRGLSHGFDGWIDDDLAFVQPWGFDLHHISVPVQLWQGDDDFMVPHSHSRWLASKIPGAEVKFMQREGHISLGVKHRYDIVTQLKAFLGV
ncbi:MAG: alpha/beta hydrolase [Candidatus Nanopelagicaceae bacterium]|nr:alpha/beta hydrolase [Candidatus Nanopelagicaceae bacterium]